MCSIGARGTAPRLVRLVSARGSPSRLERLRLTRDLYPGAVPAMRTSCVHLILLSAQPFRRATKKQNETTHPAPKLRISFCFSSNPSATQPKSRTKRPIQHPNCASHSAFPATPPPRNQKAERNDPSGTQNAHLILLSEGLTCLRNVPEGPTRIPAQSYGRGVRIRGPSEVAATVCSQWEENDPSSVTTPQSSSNTKESQLPLVSIGSIASTLPS